MAAGSCRFQSESLNNDELPQILHGVHSLHKQKTGHPGETLGPAEESMAVPAFPVIIIPSSRQSAAGHRDTSGMIVIVPCVICFIVYIHLIPADVGMIIELCLIT